MRTKKDLTIDQRNDEARRWLTEQGDSYVNDFLHSVFEKPLIEYPMTDEAKGKLTVKNCKACSLKGSRIAEIFQSAAHPLASRFKAVQMFPKHYLREALRVQVKWLSERFIRKHKLNDLGAYDKFRLDHDNLNFV